jgi:hypothetical protein
VPPFYSRQIQDLTRDFQQDLQPIQNSIERGATDAGGHLMSDVDQTSYEFHLRSISPESIDQICTLEHKISFGRSPNTYVSENLFRFFFKVLTGILIAYSFVRQPTGSSTRRYRSAEFLLEGGEH